MGTNMANDSFSSRHPLQLAEGRVTIFRLDALSKAGLGEVERLPYSIRVLLENLLRHEDGVTVRPEDIERAARWDAAAAPKQEIGYRPARVLLQDFTGVPAVADLAAMREAFAEMGGDPARIDPLQPVDLVIDHSVQVDSYGSKRAFEDNVRLEFERNAERYLFLRWGQSAFRGLRVVPPGTGIVHQVNLEYLASVVFASKGDGETLAYPDTLVGTDSHTTMVNGLGVLGWGVGGIEAEAAMLGQAISMLLPQVVGCKLKGSLGEGVTATDLVLTVTEMLRARGVVGKFVEFYGEGLSELSLPNRATIANMAPEYGATCGFFPVDDETLDYLRFTGRDPGQIDLVERYCKEQALFRTAQSLTPRFSETLELDLGDVESSLAGPRRPQDRILLRRAKAAWSAAATEMLSGEGPDAPHASVETVTERGAFTLRHGSVVIAAITSCTNTSNPAVLIAAGLVARKASERGLRSKPWVKTSFAPGSQVVSDYLTEAGLMEPLQMLGFHLVGFGCTTCIGNSGPLDAAIVEGIRSGNLIAAAVLSGNRNFEGRINPAVRANYLASPPLVVAYALAGHMDFDFEQDPLGSGSRGEPIFLRDIWPSEREIRETMRCAVKSEMFKRRYANVFEGPEQWRELAVPTGSTYAWDQRSTYARKPPFFENVTRGQPAPPSDVAGARVLVMVGDTTTTDHISPAGGIALGSPAAEYLQERGVRPRDFNSYGSRRGNHEIMVRGTFANIRLRNELAPGSEGGVTRLFPEGEHMSVYEASVRYQARRVPLLVLAGKEYGTGSSRDWAAKGTKLLGVRAVIAESYERIHRSNLIGMGVLPLEFDSGQSRMSLGLSGEELYSIEGIASGLRPGCVLTVKADGRQFQVTARLDTPREVEYYLHGGILEYVLRQLAP
ncbi:MAG: aconitate hydratase AcnA [Proteobacteria bacterium]|nr:aconitate hydratase AcnA [Pseudomonadota bacterium]